VAEGYANTNPLLKLGEYSWDDYYKFKDHLRLPTAYLKIAFKEYRTVAIAARNVSEIVAKLHQRLWESKVHTLQERKYITYGVPPQYLKEKIVLCSSAKNQTDFDWLVGALEQWVPKGKAFYFFSEFNMEGAVEAGAMLVRKASDKKLKAYFVSFPHVIEAIKRFDPDDPVVERIKKEDLLVLWAVGSEYTTDFNTGRLKELIDLRCINGKSTVLCSGLTPLEFRSRYGMDPMGITIDFKGKKITATIDALRKELERG